MKNQTPLSITLTLLSLGVFVFSALTLKPKVDVQAAKLNCSTIGNYEDAQKLYKSNPEKYAVFDRNNDGIACNELLKK